MKSMIEKLRVQNHLFSKTLTTHYKVITDKRSAAEKCRSSFIMSGANLAAKIPHCAILNDIFPIS